jgi:hypothetical protein
MWRQKKISIGGGRKDGSICKIAADHFLDDAAKKLRLLDCVAFFITVASKVHPIS